LEWHREDWATEDLELGYDLEKSSTYALLANIRGGCLARRSSDSHWRLYQSILYIKALIKRDTTLRT
jgi:hypothetical protein